MWCLQWSSTLADVEHEHGRRDSTLGGADAGDDGVGGDEASERGGVVAGVVVNKPDTLFRLAPNPRCEAKGQ